MKDEEEMEEKENKEKIKKVDKIEEEEIIKKRINEYKDELKRMIKKNSGGREEKKEKLKERLIDYKMR